MKSRFFLNTKAWQLNLISIFLFFSCFAFSFFGTLYLRLALNAWNIFTLIYLNTLSHFIEGKIPLEKRPDSKFFTFALFLQIILFLTITFSWFGPERLIDSDFYIVLLVLFFGFVTSYCYYYVMKNLLLAEGNSYTDFTDVIGEYYKTSFGFLGIFSIQKRAINGLGYNKNCL